MFGYGEEVYMRLAPDQILYSGCTFSFGAARFNQPDYAKIIGKPAFFYDDVVIFRRLSADAFVLDTIDYLVSKGFLGSRAWPKAKEA